MIRLYGVLTNIRTVCNAFMAESDIGRQTAIRMFDEGIAPGKIALKLGVRLYIVHEWTEDRCKQSNRLHVKGKQYT